VAVDGDVEKKRHKRPIPYVDSPLIAIRLKRAINEVSSVVQVLDGICCYVS